MTEDRIFDIEFDHQGKHYKGWANPSDKNNEEGLPASYHVVLNNVAFGYVSQAGDKWTVHEQRPEGLAEAVGEQIQRNFIAKLDRDA